MFWGAAMKFLADIVGTIFLDLRPGYSYTNISYENIIFSNVNRNFDCSVVDHHYELAIHNYFADR